MCYYELVHDNFLVFVEVVTNSFIHSNQLYSELNCEHAWYSTLRYYNIKYLNTTIAI